MQASTYKVDQYSTWFILYVFTVFNVIAASVDASAPVLGAHTL